MTKMICACICTSLILTGMIVWADDSALELPFQIIVHSSNPQTEFSRKDISKLFLKKTQLWKQDNKKVLPVDLREDAPVRERFSDEIHKKAVSSVKAYWQKQVFSGRGVPPEEKQTEEEILQYVSEHEGAVGYISKDLTLEGYDVRVLIITK